MKKLITTFMMFAMMAVAIPMLSASASAQSGCYENRYGELICDEYKKPNVYDRHRNVINIGIGTGAGALIGGLLGGKKGALIGAAIGAGGSALYTYKINPKTKSQISGETLGGFRPQSSKVGAPKSSHKEGLAVDLYDPDGAIDSWCMVNFEKMAECGIYIEHPSKTIGWSHWTIKRPGSGNRVFFP